MCARKLASVLSLLCAIIACNCAQAQQGYTININLESATDTTFYLANYYGDKFFIADTSHGQPGKAQFIGLKPLKQGIYLLANAKKEKLIEFLVGNEQFFSITAGKDNSRPAVVVEGSIDSQLFFEHIALVNDSHRKIEDIKLLLDKSSLSETEKNHYLNQLDSINQSISDFRMKIISTYPTLLFTKILKAMEDPVIPEEIKNEQDLAYKYYKSNFWANVDLSDERLILTPLLPMKLKTYFEQLVLPDADSVIKEVDALLGLTNGNEIMLDYLIWHFIAEYQTPKIMGLDKVFVHIVDQYVAKGKLGNLTPSIEKQLLERAGKMRRNLLGLKAPDMWLVDTTGNFRSFNEISNQFTVIIFWDQTCGHCKKEMETLSKLYQTNTYDLGVYAVNSTNDFEGWKRYLNEKKYPWLHVNGMKSMTEDFHNLYDIYSVPVIYLLDKKKNIIGKRISAEQLSSLMDNYLKTENK